MAHLHDHSTSLSGKFRDGFRTLRNRLIANPSFQTWAFRLPGVRRIARREANDLFDVVAGFVYSQILFAALELDLIEKLADGPKGAAELARDMSLPELSAELLLKAADALDLADRTSDGRFMLGRLGAALKANPWLRGMVEHHAMLYRDLEDPVALLRQSQPPGHLAAFWPYAAGGEASQESGDAAERYSRLMAQSQAAISDMVLDSYDFSAHQKMVDVGGGEGAFLEAAMSRVPHLHGTVFELPDVAGRAENHLSGAGLADRSTVHCGSFLEDSWPTGADLITVIRVLHDHDDEPVKKVLCDAYNSLQNKGVLLVAEPMAGTPGAERMGDAYFGFYLKAMGSGRPRPKNELVAMLKGAGFAAVTERPTRNPMMVRVLTACRP